MNGRNVGGISSSSDNSYAQEVLKLSNATNPTNANWIANPTVVGTFEWDQAEIYSSMGSIWYKYFVNIPL